MTSTDPAPHDELAGIVSRGVAAVIDLVVVLVLLGLLYVGLILVRLAQAPAAFAFPAVDAVFSTAVTFVVAVLYLTCCWAVSGCTAGAVTMGLRVVGRASPRVRSTGCACARDHLRRVSDRPGLGRRGPATKIVARHRVSYSGDLLSTVRTARLSSGR